MHESQRDLRLFPVELARLEDIDIEGVIRSFVPPAGSRFERPRIAFIGVFSNLSQTCQRHIAKTLNFEYYPLIPFGSADPVAMSQLTSKWSEVFGDFTRLIVLGDHTITEWRADGVPEMAWEDSWRLFRAYKGSNRPIFAEQDIPILPESEILRLHSNYPNIDNSTSWHDEPRRPWPKKKQRTLLDLV